MLLVFVKTSDDCQQESHSRPLKLATLRDRAWSTQGTKLNNVVSAVQCREECTDAYIGTTLHKCMAQPRNASSSGQEAAINVHFKDKGCSLQDSNGKVLAREDRNLQRGVKEAIVIGGGVGGGSFLHIHKASQNNDKMDEQSSVFL